MRPSKILILAGTRDGRLLSDQLSDVGHSVVTSYAGVTREPILPRGEIRTGGFGGVEALTEYLQHNQFTHVVDATHPFAVQMSSNAWTATAHLKLPLLRLGRPPWTAQEGDKWNVVDDMAAAAEQLDLNACVMVTTGRKNLEAIFARSDLTGLVRTIETPETAWPKGWRMVQDRPPYTLKQEILMMQSNGITQILCKNAGGPHTVAKIDAARELGLTVVMIKRPEKPQCDTVELVQDALQWLKTMGLESPVSHDSLGTSNKG